MKTFTSLRGLSPRTSMSRYVDDFFNDGYRRMLSNHSMTGDEMTIPAANVREHHEGTGYIIEIAAPGYRREDFDVSVHDNVLTISAERESRDGNGNDHAQQHRYTRREHYYHNFERSFMLPEHVNEDEISASYRDGILHVLVPTHRPDTQRRKPRRIDIG